MLACGQVTDPARDPGLEPTHPGTPSPVGGGGQGGGAASPPPTFWGSLHVAQPGPLSPSPPGAPGEACRAPTCGCGPRCGCGRLREPRPGGVSKAPAPWGGNQGSPRDEVALLMCGTPVCVRVEKAVDRLKPGKRTGGQACWGWGWHHSPAPPPTYRVGSCCRLKPPATFTTLRGLSGPP